MKKRIFTTLTCCLLASLSFAQISTKEMPRSFKTDINTNNANALMLSSPDMDAIQEMDTKRDSLFKMRACAVLIPIEDNFFDRATKYSIDGGNLYVLRIKIEGALALNYYSNNFYIPKGGELYIYNPSHSKTLGAFTSDNNLEDGYFAIDYVYGDEMIMEYYQPYSTLEQAKLDIEKVGYFYRDVVDFEQLSALSNDDSFKASAEYRSSGNCNVNVNCSEGDNYRNERDAVVRLYIPINYYQAGWCSGTLLNNTSKDHTPYIMSAAHCMQEMDTSHINYYHSQTIVYFNYQTTGCSTPNTEPGYNSMTGLTLLAYDDKFGKNGCDFWFTKLQQTIPTTYNPYWSGWTRSTSASRRGVGIHHPAGDVKKISTYTSSIAGYNYSSTQWVDSTHWFVEWSQTTNGFGITEGGSSGSGLWNRNNYYVGLLSGGVSDCSQNSDYQFDWYGKFYVAYPYCKSWLDPTNTDSTSIKGSSYTENSSIETIDNNNLSIELYPNPASQNITINTKNTNGESIISILDDLGRVVYSERLQANAQNKQIDISSLSQGIYYVRLYQGGDSAIKRFIKQ